MPLNGRTETIAFKCTPALKFALETEAWEEQLKLGEYVRGLLERRGKWARTVQRQAGGYDLQMEIRKKE
jgi:hypothetical protein